MARYLDRNGDDEDRYSSFIAFSDILIATLFFLCLYTIASTLGSSLSLAQVTIQKRQQKVRFDVLHALAQNNPNWSLAPFDESTQSQTLFNGLSPVAIVYQNASYQRFCIFPDCFAFPSGTLTAEGQQYFLSMGRAVQSDFGELSYVNLQGISNVTADPTHVSRLMADNVETAFKESGVIGLSANGGIPLRFIIPCGTGNQIYTDLANRNRVDIVLFYSNVGK